MPEKNVETVRRAVEEFNEVGFDGVGASDLLTDDVEFHEPPEQPAPRVARGRDEVRKLAGEFDRAWEEHKSELLELRALDADRVLLVSVERFKGRDGIELEAPFAAIFTLRRRQDLALAGVLGQTERARSRRACALGLRAVHPLRDPQRHRARAERRGAHEHADRAARDHRAACRGPRRASAFGYDLVGVDVPGDFFGGTPPSSPATGLPLGRDRAGVDRQRLDARCPCSSMCSASVKWRANALLAE